MTEGRKDGSKEGRKVEGSLNEIMNDLEDFVRFMILQELGNRIFGGKFDILG